MWPAESLIVLKTWNCRQTNKCFIQVPHLDLVKRGQNIYIYCFRKIWVLQADIHWKFVKNNSINSLQFLIVFLEIQVKINTVLKFANYAPTYTLPVQFTVPFYSYWIYHLRYSMDVYFLSISILSKSYFVNNVPVF